MALSVQEAEVLAHKDKLRLLKTRKLTLVVDLDQTLIHTSTDPHIEPGLPVSSPSHTVEPPNKGHFGGNSFVPPYRRFHCIATASVFVGWPHMLHLEVCLYILASRVYPSCLLGVSF